MAASQTSFHGKRDSTSTRVASRLISSRPVRLVLPSLPFSLSSSSSSFFFLLPRKRGEGEEEGEGEGRSRRRRIKREKEKERKKFVVGDDETNNRRKLARKRALLISSLRPLRQKGQNYSREISYPSSFSSSRNETSSRKWNSLSCERILIYKRFFVNGLTVLPWLWSKNLNAFLERTSSNAQVWGVQWTIFSRMYISK